MDPPPLPDQVYTDDFRRSECKRDSAILFHSINSMMLRGSALPIRKLEALQAVYLFLFHWSRTNLLLLTISLIANTGPNLDTIQKERMKRLVLRTVLREGRPHQSGWNQY